MKGMISMQMTVTEMRVKYPKQWLGISEPVYKNNDGINLVSGNVVYVGETKKQLLMRQLRDGENIIHWYTSSGEPKVGLYNVSWKK